MLTNIAIKTGFYLYELGWTIAIVFLKRNKRIADGFDQRLLKKQPPNNVDIWLQSASGGEAYLSWEILKTLETNKPLSVLLTSNTRQGIEILERAQKDIAAKCRHTINISFSPFDKPALMEKAVKQINPKVMVLVELEMWPGLLKALRFSRCKTIIVNGRLTEKSLKAYLKWPSLWQALAPDKILAISPNDAERFEQLFPDTDISLMPNIKFDRFSPAASDIEKKLNPLAQLLDTKKPVIILGSVRAEEEEQVGKIVAQILSKEPEALICLFPRHMHRTEYWKNHFDQKKYPWCLRSETQIVSPNCSIILWDTFGELGFAYELADAAFIGGSLAPLGGQNFLEAITCGLTPVIGPSWENFEWTGAELINMGLLFVEDSWLTVAEKLLETAHNTTSKDDICQKAARYLNHQRGGTNLACKAINELIYGAVNE